MPWTLACICSAGVVTCWTPNPKLGMALLWSWSRTAKMISPRRSLGRLQMLRCRLVPGIDGSELYNHFGGAAVCLLCIVTCRITLGLMYLE
jgi:hypothetical protein